jgi:hypothetical protein
MKNLGPQQYFLINDKAIPLSREVQEKCQRGKFLKRENELSIFAIEEANSKKNKFLDIKKLKKKFLQSKFSILFRLYFNKIPKFDPSGNFKYSWDFAHMILILFYLFWIPLHIAFDRHLRYFVPSTIYYFAPYSLLADMVVNFNTGFFNKVNFDKKK